jgi:hypothetical protein
LFLSCSFNHKGSGPQSRDREIITYKSDTRGNTTEVIDPSNRSATYGVNKLDQVETESKAESFVKMTYDATGELSTKQILTGVDAAGQPIFRDMTFGVDEVGRLHTRTDGDQATTIGYDPKGNIKTFMRSGKPPATFGYDARDRFTTESVGTQNTIYGYDDNNALSTLTNARNKNTIYVKSGFGESLGDTNPIGITTRQTTEPHVPGVMARQSTQLVTRSNVERLTDVAGATVERCEYDGYGRFSIFKASSVQVPTTIPLRWNG